jgi:hypothetical protein
MSFVNRDWIVPITQGHVGAFQTLLNNEPIKMILVSRRSKHQAGMRFTSRGIDDNGNVANFVETEQIIVIRNFIFSHVAIRGSVPVFWMQEGIENILLILKIPLLGVGHGAKLTRSLALSNPAFLKHFRYLENMYGKIICVNLMGDSKKEQVCTNYLNISTPF